MSRSQITYVLGVDIVTLTRIGCEKCGLGTKAVRIEIGNVAKQVLEGAVAEAIWEMALDLRSRRV